MPIFLILVLALSVLMPHSAQSSEPPLSLVIIDTGFDTSIPTIQSASIHEACILDWSMCPNGDSKQEGPGSASIQSSSLTINGLSHGTQMASIALDANPQIKLVLLKLIAYNSRGHRLPVYDSSINKAFRWILENESKFNVGAVAMAQGHHSLLSGKNYCPRNIELEKMITELKILGIPVFFPAGNSGDKSRIDWPACIPAAYSIGALDKEGSIASYSNYDRNLNDFYVLGNAQALLPGGAKTNATGTSVSTLIAASHWMQIAYNRPELSATSIHQLFRSSGPIIFDSQFRYGRKMDLESALRALL